MVKSILQKLSPWEDSNSSNQQPNEVNDTLKPFKKLLKNSTKGENCNLQIFMLYKLNLSFLKKPYHLSISDLKEEKNGLERV